MNWSNLYGPMCIIGGILITLWLLKEKKEMFTSQFDHMQHIGWLRRSTAPNASHHLWLDQQKGDFKYSEIDKPQNMNHFREKNVKNGKEVELENEPYVIVINKNIKQ